MCADPNNLPFSNRAQQGFENRIADLIARGLGGAVRYTWWEQRKNYVRNTLGAGRCDVIIGIPAGSEAALTTQPYYRSTYALVYRKDRGLKVRSLYDPALNKLRIGVHVVDDNYAPPAHILARRGVVGNVTGFSLFGANGQANPPAGIFEALARGDIDVAIVWGPFAGYYARQSHTPIEVVPLDAAQYRLVPLAYDISIGVREGRRDLKAAIERALARDREQVQRILGEYGVPQVRGA